MPFLIEEFTLVGGPEDVDICSRCENAGHTCASCPIKEKIIYSTCNII
jgi:heterodisulfide reductase subunit C